MQDLVKRVQLLHNLITLDELDLLAAQAEKLRSMTDDDRVHSITVLILKKDLLSALEHIDLFLADATAVVLQEDPKIGKFKTEIRILQRRISELDDEKTDLERQVHLFNARYQKEIAPLMLTWLKMRRDHLEERAQQDPFQKQVFDEAQQEYEQYQAGVEAGTDSVAELSEAQTRELKTMYRKASWLCHPDVLSDDVKEIGEATFKRLKEAYVRNDLEQVRAIFESLRKGDMVTKSNENAPSEHLRNKARLQAEVHKLRLKVQQVEAEIDAIRQREAYLTMSQYDNWDDYFDSTKDRIIFEIGELERPVA